MTRRLLLLLTLVPTAAAFAQDAPAPPAQPAAPAAWYERLRFSGDFRSRYEGFYEQDHATRNRVRLRLRVRMDTDINEDTSFHLQLASGDPGTPVSTNQTFTEFFTPKPFNLDRAYVAYNPKAADAVTLGLGKFPTPVSYTQMLFDDDLNFEGGWEQLAFDVRDGVDLTLGSLQTAVNERTAAADSYMVAAFGELGFAAGQHAVLFSIADYAWGNPDQIATGSVNGPLESILTNALVRNAAGTIIGYQSRFNVVDAIAEATIRTARMDYPLRLLAEYARNTRAVNDRDSGLWFEAEYGRPRAAGTWSAAYTYGWVEQDVTPSAFVFSDMPGTNLRIHMIETSYFPKAGLSLDTTLHLTQPLVVAPSVAKTWLTRLHLAAVVRF